MSDCGIVIPCHMGSTRFPGKPLAIVGGKPLLSYAVESARESGLPFVVASSDNEVIQWSESEGVNYVGTGGIEIRNGTERAAIANRYTQWDRVIVLQCDEPDVTGEDLRVIAKEQEWPQTLVAPMSYSDWGNMNSVAACVYECSEGEGVIRAFTRAAPCDEDTNAAYHRHVGIYCYTQELLDLYYRMTPTEVEISVSLEQIRIMQLFAWYAIILDRPLRSVNVPADVEKFTEDARLPVSQS